jgi:DNA repair protein RecO (recombination protein O)
MFFSFFVALFLETDIVYAFMIENFTGIVLRMLKYNDNLMIADIFTSTRGRLSFLVPVTHSKRSKVRSVLFQPLTILQFQAPYKQGGKLCRLSEVRPHIMYSSIPYDPCKSAVALYLAEFLTRALREESDNAAIFSFIEYSLRWFDEAADGYANFHLLFLMRLTRFLGIAPNVEDMGRSGYFDLRAGCFVGLQPMHGDFLTSEQALDFFSLYACDYDDMHRIALNRAVRSNFLTTIGDYYRLHIPEFPELNSTEVLRELFD